MSNLSKLRVTLKSKFCITVERLIMKYTYLE